jgi:hypothetical protein
MKITGLSDSSITSEVLTSSFDLPIFDHVTKHDEAAVDDPQTRTVILRGIPEYVHSLEQALALGEEHFGTLARHNIATPPHTWGLKPIDGTLERNSHRFIDDSSKRLLPEGHLLAASVASITPVPIPADRFQTPVIAIRGYNSSQTLSEQGIRLADIQTIFGSLAPDKEAGAELPSPPLFWLRNIDLVFRQV